MSGTSNKRKGDIRYFGDLVVNGSINRIWKFLKAMFG